MKHAREHSASLPVLSAACDLIPVVALFVDPLGPYPSMLGVDCWDETREARDYRGAAPVVAHPPCQLWTNLAHVNFKRYGGDHNRPGNDGRKFAFALAAVRRCGGVLEHPAFSNAWEAHGLTRPPTRGVGWFFSGLSDREYVCEVWQSAYGHKARKRTWLFYAGSPPADLDWSRNPGTHQCGWFDRIKPTLGKREASSTPIAFAEALVSLARLAQGSGVAK